MKGKVKWFSTEKGYGFITSDNNDDHYFNVQNIVGADLPTTGDIVSFEPIQSARGLRAKNIKINSTSTARSSDASDDRIECPDCNRKIVPRIITDKGELDRSVCPFCGTEIEDFNLGRILISSIINALIRNPKPSLIVLGIFVFLISMGY